MDIDCGSGAVAERQYQVDTKGSQSMRRVVAGLLIGGLVVAPITYMAADREPPFVRLGGRVIPNTLHSGDEFTVEWDLFVNTHRRCWAVGGIEITFIDSAGAIKILEPQPVLADPSNRDAHISRVLRLPMGMTDGPARYRAVGYFACNVIQQYVPIRITGPDLLFTVLHRETS
jgi:hypothetical protein